ncbi:MAG: hypothetical protein OXC94_09375 [Chloroflexi bacterium]|nr:hypothetical protein [Chloroflexota bacterium]
MASDWLAPVVAGGRHRLRPPLDRDECEQLQARFDEHGRREAGRELP